MPKLDLQTLSRELADGRWRPVYVIVGEENYLALSALRLIKEAAGKGAESNTTSLTGREAKPENVLQPLRTVSMFGGRPLVIIRDGESLSKDILPALAEYIENPVDSATLVIAASKLDGRSKFMQMAAKNAVVIECKPLYDNKVPAWVAMEFRRFGKQVSQDASKFLAEMIGNNLGELAQAMERVVLYVGKKATVDVADVEEAVCDVHQRTVFEFADAVGRRDVSKALSYLHNILENDQVPVMVLGMLARHFRILIKAKDAAGRMGGPQIAGYLGVHPYYAENYLSQAQNFSRAELARSFRVLSNCDRDLKSSRLPKERVMERAVLSLISK